jgi:hypothetical protein
LLDRDLLNLVSLGNDANINSPTLGITVSEQYEVGLDMKNQTIDKKAK